MRCWPRTSRRGANGPRANCAYEQRPGGEPPAPTPDPDNLVIDAPSELRTLLLRNLDLARLAALTGAEAPDEAEWLRLVAAAPAQVRELLETEGYFHPEVKVERERGPPPVVHVRVVPGPRARIQEVTLSVQGVLRERADAGDEAAREQIQALHAWWPLPPGDTFRNPDWAAAKKDALGRLRAAGYAAASIASSAAEVDADTSRVQLTLTLDSGPLFRAGELHIVGLQLHDEAAVRHLAGFGPGAPLTEQMLLDYQERLRKANLYDTIVVSFDNDPAKADASPVTRDAARAAAAVAHARRRHQRQQRAARDRGAHAPPHLRLRRDAAQQDRIRPRPPGLGRRAEHAILASASTAT